MSAAVTERDLVGLFSALLARSRIDLTNEKRAQANIAELLTTNDIDHLREHRLGTGDIPDFFLPHDPKPCGTVMEVKMNRSRPAATRMQLERYAKYDQVRALILVTNRAMPLPAAIHGKPAHIISLGQAWL